MLAIFCEWERYLQALANGFSLRSPLKAHWALPCLDAISEFTHNWPVTEACQQRYPRPLLDVPGASRQHNEPQNLPARHIDGTEAQKSICSDSRTLCWF